MNHVLANRLLLVCASLLLLVALVVALRVIPAVGADTSPNAVPGRAVPAFWVNAGVGFLVAVACGAFAVRSRGPGRSATAGLVVIGLAALMLGLALADAADAFLSHELLARGTPVVLFACAAADLAAGTMVLLVAYRTRGRAQGGRT